MRLRRVAVIVPAVLAVPLLAFTIWDRLESSRLSRRLDALFPVAEPGLTRAVSETDQQKEALRLYTEAAASMTSVSVREFQNTGTIIEALSLVPRAQAAHDPRLEELRRAEAPFARCLELLDCATALDSPRFEAGPRRPDQFLLRRLANANAVRIARRAFDGDRTGASTALAATLRLRRVLPPVSAINSVQTAHSVQLILKFAPPAEPTLEVLQREYESAQPEHGVEDALIAQRTVLVQLVVPEEFDAASPFAGGPRMNALEAVVYRVTRPLRHSHVRVELQYYDEALQVAAQPWPAKLDAAKAIGDKYGFPRPFGSRPRSFWERLTPIWSHGAFIELVGVTPRVAETLARVRALATTLAIERYRRAHAGAVPASLAELTPAYLSTIPIDPFTGSGLRIRREANEYKVYSVGANRQDDGGAWEVKSDLNPFRRGDPKDIGIAVWHD